MNEKQRFSPETGKPNPISMREYMIMDVREQNDFRRSLTKEEKKTFDRHYVREYLKMPLKERREVAQAAVKKLEQRENKTIGQKLEFWQAKAHLTHLMLPEKQPIFFRKLRTKGPPLPKAFREAKSPYLISPLR